MREIHETRGQEVDNYKSIHPERGMTVSEAKSLEEEKLTPETRGDRTSEFGGKYNSYEERIDHTLSEGKLGKYEGERGESKFIPSEETKSGIECREKLAEYGQDGIEYKNGEPIFVKVSEASVKIEGMTEHRPQNFAKADFACARLWNDQKKDGKSDWTDKDVSDWRKTNECSWHERCDTKTMDLVPRKIHDFFGHLGGVSECKVRDGGNNRGEFDE